MTVHKKNTTMQLQKGDETLNELKIKLPAVRVNAGLSQQDIADKMGVSRITVGNWESGKVKIKEAEIRMYADICSFPRENIFLPY